MAYLGGGFTSAVAAAGNAILSGKELQERDEDIQLKKQQIAMGQIAVQNAQRQQQTQATVGAFLSSEAQKDASSFTDPAKSAQLYEKAAGLALQGGDFVSANEMGELAKGKMQEAKEQLVVAAQQKHQKQEDLATTADDYSTNPTPEGAKDLMRKAIDAGVNPTSIPMPGTPQWGTWVNSQKQAGMDSKSRAELAEKAYESDQNRQQRWQEHKDNINTRLQEHRDNVMLREAMIQARAPKAPQTKDINGSIYEYDPTGTVKGDRDTGDAGWVKIGDKLTAQQIGGASRGTYAAAEIHRTLANVMKFDPGTTTSPFAHLGATTPLDAMVKVGARKLTPAQSQALEVNATGLGNFIASLDSSMGGRMAAGTQQGHLQDMATPGPGDSGYTALYKIANAKEMAVTALKYLPGNIDKTEKGKELVDGFNKDIPFSTDDVIKMMKNDPQAKKDDAEIRKLVSDSAKVKSNIEKAAPEVGSTGLPGSPDAGAGTNLPPVPPANIQSLLDKYK